MTALQLQWKLEEKIRAHIEIMLCRVRILELDARQARINALGSRRNMS